MWLVTFLAVIGFEAITPLSVGLPPVWEICLTTLFTYAVMGFVDHERPVAAVWQTFVADLTAPRGSTPTSVVTSTRKVRIRHGGSTPARRHRTAIGRRVRAPREVG